MLANYRDDDGRQKKVFLIPAGAMEQHGPHLPVDTDILLPTPLCEAAAKTPDLFVTAFCIPYGFNEHNMEFLGTVHIGRDTLVNYSTEVASMGFRNVVFVNGHWSNTILLEIAARLVTMLYQSQVRHGPLVFSGYERNSQSEGIRDARRHVSCLRIGDFGIYALRSRGCEDQ